MAEEIAMIEGESVVIDMAAERIAREPHQQGPCVCVRCRHEWRGGAPEGTLNMECPACHLNTGIFAAIILPSEDIYGCRCGNIFFTVTRTGIVCVSCGMGKQYSELE